MWWLFALGSAVFAALTSILAKIGIEGVNSNLATAIRTVIIFSMALPSLGDWQELISSGAGKRALCKKSTCIGEACAGGLR